MSIKSDRALEQAAVIDTISMGGNSADHSKVEMSMCVMSHFVERSCARKFFKCVKSNLTAAFKSTFHMKILHTTATK